MSSKTRRSLPLYIFAYSSLRIMFRAFPMWRGPDGNGASLIVTFLFSALGNSFSPSLISLLEVFIFSFESCFFCFSGFNAFTSCTISCTMGVYLGSCDFLIPSANKLGTTDPAFAIPPYLIAFSRAYALIVSFEISTIPLHLRYWSIGLHRVFFLGVLGVARVCRFCCLGLLFLRPLLVCCSRRGSW